MNLKAENLRPASSNEVRMYKYLKQKPAEYYKSVQDNPQLKQALAGAEVLQRDLSASLSHYSPVPLSTLGYALPPILLLHVYFKGFIKTFLLITFVWYPLMLLLPDMKARKPLLSSLKNLPVRLAAEITRSAGRNVPTWAAAALIVAFYAIGFYAYFSPGSSLPRTAATAASAGPHPGLEAAYAAGYDDGSAGKPYSFVPPSPSSGARTKPPPPPPAYDPSDPYASYTGGASSAVPSRVAPPGLPSLLTFGNALSTFVVYKSVNDLGAMSAWNPTAMVENAKANPLRFVGAAFAGYRLLNNARAAFF